MFILTLVFHWAAFGQLPVYQFTLKFIWSGLREQSLSWQGRKALAHNREEQETSLS